MPPRRSKNATTSGGGRRLEKLVCLPLDEKVHHHGRAKAGSRTLRLDALRIIGITEGV